MHTSKSLPYRRILATGGSGCLSMTVPGDRACSDNYHDEIEPVNKGTGKEIRISELVSLVVGAGAEGYRIVNLLLMPCSNAGKISSNTFSSPEL